MSLLQFADEKGETWRGKGPHDYYKGQSLTLTSGLSPPELSPCPPHKAHGHHTTCVSVLGTLCHTDMTFPARSCVSRGPGRKRGHTQITIIQGGVPKEADAKGTEAQEKVNNYCKPGVQREWESNRLPQGREWRGASSELRPPGDPQRGERGTACLDCPVSFSSLLQ